MTEVDILTFPEEGQIFPSSDGFPGDFFHIDERDLENEIQITTLDTNFLFGSPLLPSPTSFCPDSFQNSPQSDFQPLESSSSSDEEYDNTLFSSKFGEGEIIMDNFNSFSLDASASPFQFSCLPPLPIVDQLKTEPIVVENEENTSSQVKPSKKRSRSESNSTAKKEKFTILSPDALLKLDSREIEDYIKTLCSNRSLAPAEEKELKRIRRLIKNREYAQSSRNKKKQYMEEMEKKLSDALQGSAALEKRVKELEMENKTLKVQLSKIGGVMKKDPLLLEKLREITTHSSSKIKTGAVLFIVLFSFGIFFPQTETTSPVLKPTYSTGRQLFWTKESTANLASGFAYYVPDFVLDFAARHFWTEESDYQLNTSCELNSNILTEDVSLQLNPIDEELTFRADLTNSFIPDKPSEIHVS